MLEKVAFGGYTFASAKTATTQALPQLRTAGQVVQLSVFLAVESSVVVSSEERPAHAGRFFFRVTNLN